jgi:hypothetical protein
MIGEELAIRFERCDIPIDSFHHADHVLLAFTYLSRYSVLIALEKFISALKRFTEAKGKTELYNETITFAFFFLIRERMARSAGSDWQEFCASNPDLLVWKDGILGRYYRQSTLKSDLARKVFLFPEKWN